MIRFVEPKHHLRLEDYEADLYLYPSVRALRDAADQYLKLDHRTVYIVSSTEHGGGVAEMIPSQVSLLRDLGVKVRWVVIEPQESAFFDLTKRLHNAIHGGAEPRIDDADRDLYRRVTEQAAAALEPHVSQRDILLIHDPQPAGVGARLKASVGMRAVWRCHIGLDRSTAATEQAWHFLRPMVSEYDRCVFSVADYVPDFLTDHSVIIPPAIDPLSHKNRELSVHKLTGILTDAGLVRTEQPLLYPPFEEQVERLGADGRFVSVGEHSDLGLLFRPVITEVSRWDRFKGFGPLLDAFVKLKTTGLEAAEHPQQRRRIELTRLVLAGPDPTAIADDPEGRAVLDELCAKWLALPEPLRDDVALLSLPMGSRKHNALIVNALQRCSTMVVQNSLREGFGLTATEAMIKASCVIGTQAAGLRAQITHGVHGLLTDDPEDTDGVAQTLAEGLRDPLRRVQLGRNARRRVGEAFLVPAQLRAWLLLMVELIGGVRRMDTGPIPTTGD